MRFAVCLVAIACTCACAVKGEGGYFDPTTGQLLTVEQALHPARSARDARLDELIFAMHYPLWKNVACVQFDVPAFVIEGSDGVRREFGTADLRDYVRLRLANDLSFLPVCQGDVSSLPKGTYADLTVTVETVGTHSPVTFGVALTAEIFPGALVNNDCHADTKWTLGPGQGSASRAKLSKTLKTHIGALVGQFASFMVQVRGTDFGSCDSLKKEFRDTLDR